jgi:flavin-dependent dehydrogenase
MNSPNILVVGGGPVGMACAIEARLAGLSVTVIEQRAGTVDKACGEGLMPGALPLLRRLGVTPVGRDLVGVTYRSGKHSVSHRFAGGSGMGMRRTALHDAMRGRALELGAVFETDSVHAVSQDLASVVVECASGARLEASYLLGADGLHSSVSKMVGLYKEAPANRKKRYGIRQHFDAAPWSEFIEVYYTKSAEIYITPVSDGQVGVAVLGPRGTDFEATIASVPELAKRLQGKSPSSQKSGAGSFPQLTHGRTKGRILLVGDASGYVDAITGEGLRLGFAQARVAIECILEEKPAKYERRWRLVSRDFRVLTQGLITLASSPIRMQIVPLASRFPALFCFIVNRLAR